MRSVANAVERVIRAISPSWAYRRAQYRLEMARLREKQKHPRPAAFGHGNIIR
jgi:hypothetical protein